VANSSICYPTHSFHINANCGRHTLNITRHTSYVTRHTSHVTCHMSHVTRHTSHVTRHTSRVTRHTSHVTRHTSHVTRHTSHVTRRFHPSHVFADMLCRKSLLQRQKDRQSEILAASFCDGFTTKDSDAPVASRDDSILDQGLKPNGCRRVVVSDHAHVTAQTLDVSAKKSAVLSVLGRQADDDCVAVDCVSHIMRFATPACALAPPTLAPPTSAPRRISPSTQQRNVGNSIARALFHPAYNSAAYDYDRMTSPHPYSFCIGFEDCGDDVVGCGDGQGWGWGAHGCGFDYRTENSFDYRTGNGA
jgi:hypothetical protein